MVKHHAIHWGSKDKKDKPLALQESSVPWERPASTKIIEQLHDKCSNRAWWWMGIPNRSLRKEEKPKSID